MSHHFMTATLNVIEPNGGARGLAGYTASVTLAHGVPRFVFHRDFEEDGIAAMIEIEPMKEGDPITWWVHRSGDQESPTGTGTRVEAVLTSIDHAFRDLRNAKPTTAEDDGR